MKNLITCLVVCALSGVTFATTSTVSDIVPATLIENQGVYNAGSDAGEFRANIVGSDWVDCACEGNYMVGDRVVSLVDYPDGNPDILVGTEGTVVCGGPNNPYGLPILVEWDVSIGHDGNGYCKCGDLDGVPGSSQCWWVLCEWIEQGTPVWTVDDDAGADFYYIQDAIDAASDGDEILVYPGTYTDTGDNVVDMMGKAVWLHSSDGPETTIIDGEDVRRVIICNNQETSQTQIEGFTITGGYANTDGYTNLVSNDFDGEIDWDAGPGFLIEGGIRGNFFTGGGVFTDASPTITNCVISGNRAPAHGGGLDLRGSNCAATITDCTISNNVAEQHVGGLCCFESYPTIANCLITENSASGVGGLLVANTATITNCIIRNNSESSQTWTGGLYFYGDSCIMTETTVCGNTQPQTTGNYIDGGGNTVADTCSGDPTGACCVDTSCSFGTDADCSAAGGTYLGDGSSCSGDPCGAGSTVWTVDDSGGADFYNIQDAIDAALDGDEILVYPGTYTSTGDNVVDMMGKSVWLHSSDGPETTIIDGEDARRGIVCVSGETNMSIIEGLKIIRGYTAGKYPDNCGGGMYNNYYSNPTLTNCTFTNNFAPYGGGMLNDNNSSPTLAGCTFTNNTATQVGGGMYNYDGASPTMTECTFTGNTADSLGGGMYNYTSSPTIENCTFTGNNATTHNGGGIGNYNSDLTLTNCTFENNTANQGGGIFILENSIVTLNGCDIVNNTANYGGGMYNYDNSSLTLTDTIVCGNTFDQISGEWIDGGGNTVADTCSGDPTGACCVDTSCSIGTAADCSAAGGTYLGDGSSCCDNPCGSGCPADTNGDGYVDVSDFLAVIDQWGLTNSPADVNSDGIVDSSDILIVLSNWGPCSGGSNVWTVDDDGGADFDNIQDAIDAACDGDEILVYPGTYTGTHPAHVADLSGKAVWLHSSDGPETTIINGEGVRRGFVCVNGETSGTVIEGFTITSGYATEYDYNGNGEMDWWELCGGGFYCDASSPTLTGCSFNNNDSDYAGGSIYWQYGDATILECTILDSEALWGGGILVFANYSYVISGCMISGNTATNGGGIYSEANVNNSIADCTITGNSANSGGGIRNHNETSLLTDTTVCGNIPDQIDGEWTDGGGNTIADTCPK